MRGHERGLSLIEVLASVFLISIAIVPMLELYPTTLGINRETEYDLLLSAAAIRKMEELIGLHRGTGTGKRFYLHQEVSGMAGNWLARDGVSADNAQNTTTIKGAVVQAAGEFILFQPGTINSTPGVPGPGIPQGFGWWSDARLIETFPAGTWSFRLRRSAGGTDASTARFHVRVYKVPQTTSIVGAVELFSTTSPNFTYSTSQATSTWTTASVGPFTLSDEYLLAEIWLEAVTASTAHTVTLRVEGSTLEVPSQFTTSAPGASPPMSGASACTGLPNCRLVWTVATEASSATSGVGRRDTLSVVACRDANANNRCNTGELQVRYDAKITTRP